MSLKPRTRERQAELQQQLHARREMPELHLMRELLQLRYEDAKHKLVHIAPAELLKLLVSRGHRGLGWRRRFGVPYSDRFCENLRGLGVLGFELTDAQMAAISSLADPDSRIGGDPRFFGDE